MDPISILNFQASEIVRRNLAWMHALRSQCYLLGDERGEPGEPRTPPRARSWDEHEKMYSPKGPGPSQDHSQEGLPLQDHPQEVPGPYGYDYPSR